MTEKTRTPATEEMLARMDKYWRAANYLSACQLYLLDNPLLEKPLSEDDIKKKIVGHWGTCLLYTSLSPARAYWIWPRRPAGCRRSRAQS